MTFCKSNIHVFLLLLTIISACSKKESSNSVDNKDSIIQGEVSDPKTKNILEVEIKSPLVEGDEIETNLMDFYQFGNYTFGGVRNDSGRTVVYYDKNGKPQEHPRILWQSLYGFDYSLDHTHHPNNLKPITILFEDDFIAEKKSDLDNRLIIVDGEIKTYKKIIDKNRHSYWNSYKELAPESVASDHYRYFNYNFKPFCISKVEDHNNNKVVLKKNTTYDVYTIYYTKVSWDKKTIVGVMDMVLVEGSHTDKALHLFDEINYIDSVDIFKIKDHKIRFLCVKTYKNESIYDYQTSVFEEVFSNNIISYKSYFQHETEDELGSMREYSDKLKAESAATGSTTKK